MVQPKPLDSKALYQFMENYGFKLERVSIQEWIDKIQNSEKLKPPLKSLLKEMNSNESLFPLERTKFSVKQTSEAIRYFEVQGYPPIDTGYLRKFFSKQIERNILTSPPLLTAEIDKFSTYKVVKARNIKMQSL